MINTSRKPKGNFTKAINVTTNDANFRTTTLQCEASIKVPYDMSPNIVNFGSIERDSEGVTRTFKITRGDGGPLKPEIEPVKDQNIKVTLKELKPGDEYELEVQAIPPWPTSAIQGYIDIKTGIAEVPDDKIRYYGRMEVRLRAAPNRIAVRPELQDDLKMRVRLIWSGDKPGKVLEVTATDPLITGNFIEDKGQQFIDVNVPKTFKATSRGNNFVIVKTDDAAVPELRIQIVPTQTVKAPSATDRPQAIGGNQPILRPRPSISRAPQNKGETTPNLGAAPEKPSANPKESEQPQAKPAEPSQEKESAE